VHSPGRPSVARREEQQEFWKAIAAGLSSEDAAVSCGVSPPVEVHWFRQGGGMAPISLAPRSDRYLSFVEREEIAILKAQGTNVRDIARRLDRAPSTISRELRRNAATRSGGFEYRASTAQWHSELQTAEEGQARCERPAKKPRAAAARGRDHDRGRERCRRPESEPLDGPPPRSSPGPTLVELVESAADRQSAPDRVSRR
jgi:hypothetical protein